MAKTKKSKSLAQILKDLKKSNKARRLVLAQRKGFDTYEEYRDFLEEQILKKITVDDAEEVTGEKPVIHNVHLVDCSASMTWDTPFTKYKAAIQGIDSEVEELKTSDNVTYVQSMFTFSGQGDYRLHYFKKSIQELGPFQDHVYHGNTALYYSIVKTIERLIEEKGSEKVILKIFTDGQDNNSYGTYKSQAVKLIEEAKQNGIVVTFVGTPQDVGYITRNLKIEESNTITHDNTAESVARSFKVTAGATVAYSKAVVAGTDSLSGFYKKKGTL